MRAVLVIRNSFLFPVLSSTGSAWEHKLVFLPEDLLFFYSSSSSQGSQVQSLSAYDALSFILAFPIIFLFLVGGN